MQVPQEVIKLLDKGFSLEEFYLDGINGYFEINLYEHRGYCGKHSYKYYLRGDLIEIRERYIPAANCPQKLLNKEESLLILEWCFKRISIKGVTIVVTSYFGWRGASMSEMGLLFMQLIFNGHYNSAYREKFAKLEYDYEIDLPHILLPVGKIINSYAQDTILDLLERMEKTFFHVTADFIKK